MEILTKKKRKRLSANQVRLAVARLKKGENAEVVAKELGVHSTTVRNWKNKAAKRKYRTHNKTKVTPIKRGLAYALMTGELTKKLEQLERESEAIRKMLKIASKLY